MSDPSNRLDPLCPGPWHLAGESAVLSIDPGRTRGIDIGSGIFSANDCTAIILIESFSQGAGPRPGPGAGKAQEIAIEFKYTCEPPPASPETNLRAYIRRACM